MKIKILLSSLVLMYCALHSITSEAVEIFVSDHDDPNISTDDDDAIQSAIDAANEGDTIHFGKCTDLGNEVWATPCTSERYQIGHNFDGDGRPIPIRFKHGVKYEGHGSYFSTKNYADFAYYNSFVLMSFDQSVYSGVETYIHDFVFNVNVSKLAGGTYDPNLSNKQAGLKLTCTNLGPGKEYQKVKVEDILAYNSHGRLIQIYAHVDVEAKDVTLKSSHHGIVINPNKDAGGVLVTLEDISTPKDASGNYSTTIAVKVEPPSQNNLPMHVKVLDSGSNTNPLSAIHWAVHEDITHRDINSLTIENTVFTEFFAGVFNTNVLIQGSTIGVGRVGHTNEFEPALSLSHIGGNVVIEGSNIHGHATLGIPNKDNTTSMAIRDTIFETYYTPDYSNHNQLLSGYAIQSSSLVANNDNPFHITLENTHFISEGCNGYDHLFSARGGSISVLNGISWSVNNCSSQLTPNTSEAIYMRTASSTRTSVLTDGRPTVGNCADANDPSNCTTTNSYWGW